MRSAGIAPLDLAVSRDAERVADARCECVGVEPQEVRLLHVEKIPRIIDGLI